MDSPGLVGGEAIESQVSTVYWPLNQLILYFVDTPKFLKAPLRGAQQTETVAGRGSVRAVSGSGAGSFSRSGGMSLNRG
eukprot:4047837-Prymnesium_polylepis.1